MANPNENHRDPCPEGFHGDRSGLGNHGGPNPPEEKYECNNNDYKCNSYILVAGIATLFLVFVLTALIYYVYFHWYSNRLQREFERGSRRRSRIFGGRRFSWGRVEEHFLTPSPNDQGLCAEAVEQLPVFVYSPGSFKDGLRCAVCLYDFEENQKGRLLPNCNHSFHVDCIDMWFYSHSTCPLCRTAVQSQPESDSQEVEITVRDEDNLHNRQVDSDEKSLLSGTSISQEEHQNNDNKNEPCVALDMEESKEVEERGKALIAINIPAGEK